MTITFVGVIILPEVYSIIYLWPDGAWVHKFVWIQLWYFYLVPRTSLFSALPYSWKWVAVYMVINGVPSRERQRFRLPKIRHGCHTSYVSLVFLWMYKKQRKFNKSYDPCLFNTGTSMFYGKCNIQINCMRLVYFEHLQISSIE